MPDLFTIGHSTRTLEEFVELLKAHDIDLLVDVRTIPKSRFNPQYNSEALEAGLKKQNIGYIHMPELGGLRHARKDSINTAWKNASFRGFADYMQTEEFEQGPGGAHTKQPQENKAAIMCAEAVPWRCHRSLIADALLVRGITVLDIMSRTSVKEHSLTAWAVVNDGNRITYPVSQPAAATAVPRKRKRASQK